LRKFHVKEKEGNFKKPEKKILGKILKFIGTSRDGNKFKGIRFRE
jgi:hypothetical protein